jgi:hypothetical protein
MVRRVWTSLASRLVGASHLRGGYATLDVPAVLVGTVQVMADPVVIVG